MLTDYFSVVHKTTKYIKHHMDGQKQGCSQCKINETRQNYWPLVLVNAISFY